MQQQPNDPRIHSMFNADRSWAYLSVLALWALYAFVLWRIIPDIKNSNELLALAIAGALVLLFNTASIIAMISHYAEDKEHIYGLDLHYQDLKKNSNS